MNRRVVSLLPSATEIVCAVGARDQLVGVSHECDHPPGVASLPVLTSSRCASTGTSAEIHASVQDAARAALSMYEVDSALLRELAPDVVVTQDLCEVCAVSTKDVAGAVSAMADRLVDVVTLGPTRFSDVLDDIVRVGRAVGRKDEAVTLRRSLQQRADAVRKRASNATSRPRVVTIEWIEPVMLGGTWMPDLIETVHARAVVATAGAYAPVPTPRALERLRPDVVIVKPCGFSLARALDELETLRRVLPWDAWPAVRAGRVYVADGNDYFNRPGPRLVDSLELLAACVHPELFRGFRQRFADAAVRVTADLSVVPFGG